MREAMVQKNLMTYCDSNPFFKSNSKLRGCSITSSFS